MDIEIINTRTDDRPVLVDVQGRWVGWVNTAENLDDISFFADEADTHVVELPWVTSHADTDALVTELVAGVTAAAEHFGSSVEVERVKVFRDPEGRVAIGAVGRHT